MAAAPLQSPIGPYGTPVCVSSYGQFTLEISCYCGGNFLFPSSCVSWELEQFCDYVWGKPPAPQSGPSPGVSWGES